MKIETNEALADLSRLPSFGQRLNSLNYMIAESPENLVENLTWADNPLGLIFAATCDMDGTLWERGRVLKTIKYRLLVNKKKFDVGYNCFQNCFWTQNVPGLITLDHSLPVSVLYSPTQINDLRREVISLTPNVIGLALKECLPMSMIKVVDELSIHRLMLPLKIHQALLPKQQV